MLTQKRLKEVLCYNPSSGIFTRNRRLGNSQYDKSANKRFAFKPTGSINKNGYLTIRIDRKIYRAHRLAWLYMTGGWPKDQIDHIDQNRINNIWINLREVTNSINNQNSTMMSTNTSGFNGVHWHKPSKKWMARIVYEGKRICLGIFKDKEDAIEARNIANIKYGYHPNHGRRIIIDGGSGD